MFEFEKIAIISEIYLKNEMVFQNFSLKNHLKSSIIKSPIEFNYSKFTSVPPGINLYCRKFINDGNDIEEKIVCFIPSGEILFIKLFEKEDLTKKEKSLLLNE